MDFLKNAVSGDDNIKSESNQQSQPPENSSSSGNAGGGGFLGGIGDKLNSAAGGGKESEKNEDLLDKGVDAVQQYGLGQGDQSNESAFEQAKDEQISDEIRRRFKGATGEEFPVGDRETRLG